MDSCPNDEIFVRRVLEEILFQVKCKVRKTFVFRVTSNY